MSATLRRAGWSVVATTRSAECAVGRRGDGRANRRQRGRGRGRRGRDRPQPPGRVGRARGPWWSGRPRRRCPRRPDGRGHLDAGARGRPVDRRIDGRGRDRLSRRARLGRPTRGAGRNPLGDGRWRRRGPGARATGAGDTRDRGSSTAARSARARWPRPATSSSSSRRSPPSPSPSRSRTVPAWTRRPSARRCSAAGPRARSCASTASGCFRATGCPAGGPSST